MRSCTIHFLNVGNGDCTIIEHETGRVSVIDICNGNFSNQVNFNFEANYNNQVKKTNPIEYLRAMGVKDIFRFILTHPDMDHMDGIKNLFVNFNVINFWDTYHSKFIGSDKFYGYNKDDWEFYQRRRKDETLRYYAGNQMRFFKDDGLSIISPSRKLSNYLNTQKDPDWNEISYVLLHQVFGRKILYCGDSGDLAWDSIMSDTYIASKLEDIDIIIAPHHGRKSGGDDENKYLKYLRPKLALFGNTDTSKHKNYQAFYNKGIPILTNNEAGNIVFCVTETGDIWVYMSANSWETLLKTKGSDYENFLNRNRIFLYKG